jgi:hypothetical protein
VVDAAAIHWNDTSGSEPQRTRRLKWLTTNLKVLALCQDRTDRLLHASYKLALLANGADALHAVHPKVCTNQRKPTLRAADVTS